MTLTKSVLNGKFSGMVEPISGVRGDSAVLLMQPILPYTLFFALGALVCVLAEERIPESKAERHSGITAIGVTVGYTVMKTLDFALGYAAA